MQQNTSSMTDNDISKKDTTEITMPSTLFPETTQQTDEGNQTPSLTQSRSIELHKRSSLTGDVSGSNYSTKRKSLAIRNLKSPCLRSLEAAKSLVVACKGDDFMDQFEYGNELTKQLTLMWDNRDGRERNWGKLLNFLQSALSSVEFDTIGLDASESILRVVEMLASSTIDNEDILNAKRHLSSAGLDHWAAISAKRCDE